MATIKQTSASQRLADNLRRLAADARDRDGLTSAELLALLLPGPTPSARTTWSRYLAGTHWPTPERLDSMAAVLGVDVAKLLLEPEVLARELDATRARARELAKPADQP